MEFHEKTIPVLSIVHLRDLPDRKAGKIIKAFLDQLESEQFNGDLDAETFAFVRLMYIAHNELILTQDMV